MQVLCKFLTVVDAKNAILSYTFANTASVTVTSYYLTTAIGDRVVLYVCMFDLFAKNDRFKVLTP